MKKSIKFHGLLLGLILALACMLRFFHLGINPPSPYWEEAALGYDAYSVSKTGKDMHGNPYPLIAFPSFGDYKPVGYFYALVPFVKVLGLNTLAVRLPSAFAGLISVALIYLIGKELFEERVGLVASALFAISPWSLQFSRGGWEVNLALMCVMAGVLLVLLARRKPWILPLSVSFFGYSMYTYHAARVYAPLIGALSGVVLLYVWLKEKQQLGKKIVSVVPSLVLAACIVAPLVVNIQSSAVSSRFDATSIFSNPEPVLKSNEQIALHGNTRLAKIVYHRFFYYAGLVVTGFVQHFSPEFLFFRGDGNLRHSTVAFGLMYPLDAFFILLALLSMFTKRDRKVMLLGISILLAAVAPSLVTPTPHALRFLFALPAFTLLTAYGIVEFTKTFRTHTVGVQKGILTLYFLGMSAYVFYYHTQYPIRAGGDWQYGYKQLFEVLEKNKLPGEPVYVTREQGRPSMYYLFYTAYDPSKLQKMESSLPKDQLELLQVNDYHFVDALPQGKGLYATSESKQDLKGIVIDTIWNLNRGVVWIIWRRK